MHNETMAEDQQPATKGDLRALKGTLAKSLLNLDRKFEARFETLVGLIHQFKSDMMTACESAVFKAEKVDRDQAITRYRLDQLDSRVGALEAQRKRRRPS